MKATCRTCSNDVRLAALLEQEMSTLDSELDKLDARREDIRRMLAAVASAPRHTLFRIK